MNLGRTLLLSVLLIAASSAYAAKYERTLDGKTKILRFPTQGRLQASWSGDRDENGYATGRGTLTWFRLQRSWETGSLLPSTKYIEVSHYTGKMVEGKLEGSVAFVNEKGNTYHAKFADGRKTGEWVAGPVTSKKASDEVRPKMVEAPAEAPPPAPKLEEQVAEKAPSPAPAPAKQAAATPAPEASPATEQAGDSLRTLTMPPSSLRVAALNEHPTQPSAPDSPSAEATDTTVQTSPGSADVPASPSVSVNGNDDARAVAALDSEYHTAIKTNDASTIDRILADDFLLVRSGGRSMSKSDLLKQARDKQAKYERHEVEEGTQKVRVWHDTAVVSETVWVKGIRDGKPVDEKMSVTSTYARTPNGWRYVSGQASSPVK